MLLWMELEYLISDMNCVSLHLIKYLKAKLIGAASSIAARETLCITSETLERSEKDSLSIPVVESGNELKAASLEHAPFSSAIPVSSFAQPRWQAAWEGLLVSFGFQRDTLHWRALEAIGSRTLIEEEALALRNHFVSIGQLYLSVTKLLQPTWSASDPALATIVFGKEETQLPSQFLNADDSPDD